MTYTGPAEVPVYTTVIAARTDDDLITQALDSIARQTLPPERIIVVVNCDASASADWTAAVHAASPVVELAQSDGVGLIPALNHGIALTTTPYIAFLDTDDLWLSQKQARQVAALEGATADAASCQAANFRDRPDGSRHFDPPAPAIMFTATTFRRAAFERFGPLDPSSNHFTWLYRWWSNARARGIATVTVDYVGTHRRLHADNSWVRQRDTAHRELLAEVRRHARRGST